MKIALLVVLACALVSGLTLAGGAPVGPPPRRLPPTPVVPVPPEQAALVKGNTRFALDLFAKVREKEGNLFLSPYSISSALAMTSAGAKGETAKQMHQTLRFDLPEKDLHPAFAGLTKGLNEGGKQGNYQLSVANALWAQKDYKFLDPFLGLVKDSYGAGVEPVNFAASEDARKTINTWVEKETRDKIKDLIKPGMLTADTRLVLTNAIYFKGLWLSQFKKENTKDDAFKLGGEKTVQVPMMHQEETFGFFQNDDLQVLDLPYKGEEVSMLVLLPKKVDGLAALEKALTADDLAKYVASLHKVKVDVTLPKWTATSEFGLGDTLKSLGMTDAFTPGKADFSGMDGSKDLFIQAVVHKAFVDVNEEGTEAAAATGVIVGVLSIVETPIFRADHPFLFLIRDTRTGSVLFLGRVANPKG